MNCIRVTLIFKTIRSIRINLVQLICFVGQHIPTIELEGTQNYGYPVEDNEYDVNNSYNSESFHNNQQPSFGTSTTIQPSRYAVILCI